VIIPWLFTAWILVILCLLIAYFTIWRNSPGFLKKKNKRK